MNMSYYNEDKTKVYFVNNVTKVATGYHVTFKDGIPIIGNKIEENKKWSQ